MNIKRWIAIGVAISVFAASVLVTFLGSVISTQMEGNNFFSNLVENSVQSEIIETGDPLKRIVVLDVEGIIMKDDGAAGFFQMSSYVHSEFLNNLDKVKEDKTIKGIILKVDSPGGGVYESAEIRDRLLEIKKERNIPIYVSMGSVAASGGYYISAETDKIFAARETITGSIGVIMSGLNYSGLMDKYGVSDSTIKSGEFKDLGSSYRPINEKDREILQEMVDRSYEKFVDIVAKGRKIDNAKALKIANGQVYDGEQAKQLGLVDEIGYFEDSLNALKKDNKLEGAEVFQYIQDSFGFFNMLNYKMGLLLKSKESLESLSMPLNKENSNYPRMLYQYGKQ